VQELHYLKKCVQRPIGLPNEVLVARWCEGNNFTKSFQNPADEAKSSVFTGFGFSREYNKGGAIWKPKTDIRPKYAPARRIGEGIIVWGLG